MLHLILAAYIASFFSGLYPAREARARSYIPIIIEEADRNTLDPLLIAAVITWESSWRTDARSRKGAVGLMQVMGEAARGYDLTTPRGQIAAGTRWLRVRLNECGTLLTALNAYQVGRCKPVIKGARWRYKDYQRARERFRHGEKKIRRPSIQAVAGEMWNMWKKRLRGLLPAQADLLQLHVSTGRQIRRGFYPVSIQLGRATGM
jgi:hypothetical protein